MNYPIQKSGYYGKLPIRGDFIQRNLPAQFITIWDEWLQSVLHASQKTLGDKWLDTYLVFPVWRFFLSQDSGEKYTGIILPSVDKVGRYFPFTIVTSLARETAVDPFISQHEDWYAQAEHIAIQALEENIEFDQLNQAIDNLSIFDCSEPHLTPDIKRNAYHISLNEQTSLDEALARIQSRMHPSSAHQVSYWWNENKMDNQGDLLCYPGMPDDTVFVAMMNGQWEFCPIHHIEKTN